MFPPNIPLATRGDVAAAGLGFAVGFAVDVFLFPLGNPPGTVAGVSAVACVGAKNLLQGAWRAYRKPKEVAAKRQEVEQRARTFATRLKGQIERGSTTFETGLGLDEMEKYNDRLRVEQDLWRDEVITTEQFEEALNDIIERYLRGETLS